MTNDILNIIKLDANGNMPFQIEINGVPMWLYKLEERILVDDGTGNLESVVIYQETRYMQGDRDAIKWYESNPRHHSNNETESMTHFNVYAFTRHGRWCAV